MRVTCQRNNTVISDPFRRGRTAVVRERVSSNGLLVCACLPACVPLRACVAEILRGTGLSPVPLQARTGSGSPVPCSWALSGPLPRRGGGQASPWSQPRVRVHVLLQVPVEGIGRPSGRRDGEQRACSSTGSMQRREPAVTHETPVSRGGHERHRYAPPTDPPIPAAHPPDHETHGNRRRDTGGRGGTGTRPPEAARDTGLPPVDTRVHAAYDACIT